MPQSVKEECMKRDTERKQIEALILKYEKTVYKLAYSYMKNKQDTDDIYQEVFLRFFRKKPEFESEEHEKAWFIRTTINCCKSYYLSGWVKRTMAFEEGTHGREDSYEMGGQSDLFYAVMELPVKYRTVIHLFYYEGYTVREIAGLTGEKVTTITTRLSRAREQPRDVLEPSGAYGTHRGNGRLAAAGTSEKCMRF